MHEDSQGFSHALHMEECPSDHSYVPVHMQQLLVSLDFMI